MEAQALLDYPGGLADGLFDGLERAVGVYGQYLDATGQIRPEAIPDQATQQTSTNQPGPVATASGFSIDNDMLLKYSALALAGLAVVYMIANR